MSIGQLPASKMRPDSLDESIDMENAASPLLVKPKVEKPRRRAEEDEDEEEEGGHSCHASSWDPSVCTVSSVFCMSAYVDVLL